MKYIPPSPRKWVREKLIDPFRWGVVPLKREAMGRYQYLYSLEVRV